MEYASGDALVTLVEHGEDEKATRIVAKVIKQLHSVPQDAPKDGMVMLDRWFEALFVRAAADRQVGIKSIFERGASLAEQLLTAQQEIRVLHGDIHHYNIKHSPRGWLDFDPKGVVGERTYDCANSLCNPVMPELVQKETRLLNNAAILADALELELGRVLAFTYVYACLNASLSSAAALSSAEQDRIKTRLRDTLKREVDVTFQVDASHLAGVQIHIGNAVVDSTVRGRLRAIQSLLTKE